MLLSRIFPFLLGSLYFLTACEDEVVVPLNNATPQLVIDADGYVSETAVVVTLSRSVNYYSQEPPSPVIDANVFFVNASGAEIPVPYAGEGEYIAEDIVFTPSTVVGIRVDFDGQTYRAQATVPEPVEITQITVTTEEFIDETEYLIDTRVQDNTATEDFYGIRVLEQPERIEEELRGTPSSLSSDEDFQGALVPLSFGSPDYRPGDRLEFRVESMSQAAFQFYEDLEQQEGDELGGTIPFTPRNNFTPSALGVFGLFNGIDTSFVIPE